MWIDTEEAYTKASYAAKININVEELKTNLEAIPKKIIVKDDTFILCGVAKYLPPFDEKGMGHYIALCHNNNKWIERNDLVKNKNSVNVLSNIKISGIF